MATTSNKTTKSRTKTATAKTAPKKTDEVAVEESAATSSEVADVVEEPLSNDEEIEVVSLIPNVSYYDRATSDRYEWYDAGDVQYMTVETLTRMARNHRGYFDGMAVKPLDERVIKKLNLSRIYDKYDFLMDESNYTREHIDDVVDALSGVRGGLSFSVITKIKDMVVNGRLTDVGVIRTLERRLGVDLIDMIA